MLGTPDIELCWVPQVIRDTSNYTRARWGILSYTRIIWGTTNYTRVMRGISSYPYRVPQLRHDVFFMAIGCPFLGLSCTFTFFMILGPLCACLGIKKVF